MAITIDWSNKVIESTLSITDLPAFHATLRDFEDDPSGVIHPVTHAWKALDLGGGAFFYQADLVNGYQLKFPTAGNYVINGNLNGAIVPVAGVYVERKTSAAFITTAVGGSGPTAADIAAAVLAAAQAAPIQATSQARVLEGALTEAEAQRVILAALAGKVTMAGTNIKFKSTDGLTDRIDGTVDNLGNRTAVTLNGA